MALEIILADIVATVYRTTADPLLSLTTKRKKFQCFFENNKIDIEESVLHRAYPEEIQLAVDQVLQMAEALIHKKDLS